MVLKGFRVDDLRDLVAGAMEPILKPLVYQEPLNLVARHRERGEPVYIVSATLQEIVEEIARELGFDGALGSTCEIVDGVYTGRSLRGAHGDGKAAAVRELAAQEGFDLEASTAYSDSHTDLPFLEAVGNPVVVNPDRQLRRIAEDRGLADARVQRARLPVRAAASPRAAGHPARARRRRRGLGSPQACCLRSASPPWGSPRRTPRPSLPISSTPSRAASSATGSPDRLARDAARPEAGRTACAPARRARLRALGRRRRARLPDARRPSATRSSRSRRNTRESSSPRTASRPARSAGTRGGWRRAVSSLP